MNENLDNDFDFCCDSIIVNTSCLPDEDELNKLNMMDCDNHCDFCIERNGLSAKKQDIDKMILSTIQ